MDCMHIGFEYIKVNIKSPQKESPGEGQGRDHRLATGKGLRADRLSLATSASDTYNLGKYNDTNLVSISRISLRPINVAIDQPCMKITKDFFIQQKKDFYKKREEDNNRIRDEFVL